MNITSPTGAEYTVAEDPIAETSEFRLYICTLPQGGQGLLKVAVAVEHNHELDREAFVLRSMMESAQEVETEYQATGPKGGRLNYQFCFPHIVESFVLDEQGGRRVNIMSFSEIVKNDLVELVPLEHLRSEDHVRIDPKTSAWIMGKMLKFLVFTHSIGVLVNNLSGTNILINRDGHYVAVFDWLSAKMTDEIDPDDRSNEISMIATEVVLALNGDPETGEIPADDQLPDDRYANLLKQFINGVYDDALEAHRAFYELIERLWPEGGYHPFGSYDLE